MKVKCEHPVCIFNPHLQWLYCTKAIALYIKGKVVDTTNFTNNRFYNFPWPMFYAWKKEVTPDTVDDFLLYDGDDNAYPIFIYVPCGHCKLCMESKVNDWITRAICESSASDYPPLFITLTYDRKHLPKDGVNKDDVQRFMKRLRRRVEYHLGKKEGLRFFLCAEYGKRTHRAHYHLILWNMPFVSMYEGEENSFYALWNFLRDAWQNGNIRVERCRDNSGRYCFKYMRKGCFIPVGQNDTFFLYSRRPGLGFNWLEQHWNDYFDDVAAESLSIKSIDKNGLASVVSRPIPAYFKRKLWPTVSQIFPQNVSNAVKDFMEEASKSFLLQSRLYPDSNRAERILDMVDYIRNKYGCIYPIDFDSSLPNRKWTKDVLHYEYLRSAHLCLTPAHDYRNVFHYQDLIVSYDDDGDLVEYRIDNKTTFVSEQDDRSLILMRCNNTLDNFECCSLRKQFIQSWTNLLHCFRIAAGYDFDKKEVLSLLKHTASHKSAVRILNDKKEDPDIEALVHQYDVDRRWESVHWLGDKV